MERKPSRSRRRRRWYVAAIAHATRWARLSGEPRPARMARPDRRGGRRAARGRCGGGLEDRSLLRQLQLDPAIAAERLLLVAGIDRLELAEARRGEAVRRHALGDQILNHGDGAGGRQLPIRFERAAGDRMLDGMAVDPENPGQIG